MAQNIILTCTFTQDELSTIIFKNMDWFFKTDKKNKETEYFETLCEITNAIEKKYPSRIPIYKIRIFGDSASNLQLIFNCPDEGWMYLADVKEHYGLTKIMVGSPGAEDLTWLKS